MNSVLGQGLSRYLSDAQLAAVQGICLGVAGAGGIGSNVALLLARSGVRRFVLVDDDVVEPSNLNRQMYFPKDVGRSKVDALADCLLTLDGGMDIVALRQRVTRETLAGLLPRADFWVEAFDNAQDKQMLIEACLLARRPAVGCSGMGGFGRGDMQVRRMGCVEIVGDFVSDVADFAPLAPRVAACAAWMADRVLARLWQNV